MATKTRSSSWSRRSLEDVPVIEQDEYDDGSAIDVEQQQQQQHDHDEQQEAPSQRTSPPTGGEDATASSSPLPPSTTEVVHEHFTLPSIDTTASHPPPQRSRQGSFEDVSKKAGGAALLSPASTPSNSSTPITATSPRIPAAGLGTRIRPRPVPKSSSSLRHIPSRARNVSFGTPLHEDRDPDQSLEPQHDQRSTVQRSVEAAQRREKENFQREAALDSDAEDNDDFLGMGESSALTTSSDSAEYQASHRSAHQRSDSLGTDAGMHEDSSVHGLNLSSSEDEDFALPAPDVRITSHDNAEVSKPKKSTSRSRGLSSRILLEDDDSPSLLQVDARGTSGLQTPGPNFPQQQLHTPVGTPPELLAEPTITAQERLEWHAMLQSTLRSEVLKSETKRITSADAPKFTREHIMYRRWLDIRACLRGRGQRKDAVDEEEKRLSEGWPVLMKEVIEAIKSCRSGEAEEDTLSDDQSSDLSSDKATESVIEEVGRVLEQVDRAEEQFPSFRKMAETVPEWTDAALQEKLQALYSWYNVITSLRLQIRILQEWTGSKTLDVQSRSKEQSSFEANEADPNGFRANLEEGTFLERMLKENSLQSTFEKRTLRTLGQLIMKAKDVTARHHHTFGEMALPSFESELLQLIRFPTRLMEAALRVRLDYVGKLTDPSVLIVDSLIDDLRAAVALACRIKLQYHSFVAPDPQGGWDLPPCIGSGYDHVLREALQYFFRLLNYKLKGSLFFKETEILEPEWRFLSTAVEVIDGADVLVARSITRIVNKLFIRIVRYFERELAAPSTKRLALQRQERTGQIITQMSGVPAGQPRGPSIAGGLTKGQVKMTLEEKARWIHQVFDSVRIRSRKLLYFSRDIRNRLENAAEFDLSTLRSPSGDANAPSATPSGYSGSGTNDAYQATLEADSEGTADFSHLPTASRTRVGGRMSLTEFLQTLIDAGYFLVLTGSFEAEGIYMIAEPSMHDKPELIQELFTKCMRKSRPQANDTSVATANTRADILTAAGITTAEESGKDEDSDAGVSGGQDGRMRGAKNAADQSHGIDQGTIAAAAANENSDPKYLLILTPRDAFMWTGKVMYLDVGRVDISLKDRRLRLVADGPQRRLELCKKHLYNVFGADYAAASVHLEDEDNAEDGRLQRQRRRPSVVQNGQPFPLEIVDESLAHMSIVQTELRKINKGVYLLSDTVIRSVPKIRRKMRGRRGERSATKAESVSSGFGKGGDCDELIQNCFGMAAEQGFRAMPFIESNRLRGQMTLAFARLAIDWVAFICDDCEPSDRKTFKWAVAALENAMYVTRSEDILHISEDDFILMRRKVASCVGLLISHFDILGARDSVAKAKEEEERLERERADRLRALEVATLQAELGHAVEADTLVQGSGAAVTIPMLDRLESGVRSTEERWVQKVMDWDAARQTIESEQRLIGRVLDDTRLEDRGLQFLASSSSRIQIRWQQGRFIGGGTFGTVYLAVNLDSGGLMAVKEIRFQDISSTPGMYKQIKDEMNVMEMLSHPNIVEYYGIEVHRDKVYIFEEYCQGGSLAQLLEHGRIEDEMVMQVYTLQMLDGLVYLHSKGVVHRDIKPDNILLDHMGVIKFVDFGAAKVLAKNSRTIQRSRRAGAVGPQAMSGMMGPDGKPATASLQGTPMYMSPEVIKGENRGRRGAMDVWSLGCVVLEFATGHRPWSQLDNEWAIMFHIGMAQQHPPLPEPGQLSEVGIDFIRQCLVIDPYERPSAIEMREHAWIKNLVEALNAANEEEAAATQQESAGTGDQSGNVSRQNSMYGDGSSTSSSLSSSFVHGNESAAGVAAMAATPGTRSINGFNFGRSSMPSFNSMQRVPSLYTPVTPATTNVSLGGATSGGGGGSGGGEAHTGAFGKETSGGGSHDSDQLQSHMQQHKHDPGHPNHEHPGYEALIADLAYRREEEEKRRIMATPASESMNAIDDMDL